jgi:4-amino-4-deoxy-L-arabinose transferase-like glycosyltransferase
MARKIPRALWIALPLAFLSYFYRLSAVGLIGPDEPRYASIAREMARSGDWITPRLWGQPWFEKPPLLYWMSGVGFRLGLGPEIAPRLGVALMAAAFLVFYWWIFNREFGCRPAWFATLILGTCGGWLGFSQVGVTDLPMTATFSAAMLLALPWIARQDALFLPAASALLGFAVLAKSGVPLVLALPVIWNFGGSHRNPNVGQVTDLPIATLGRSVACPTLVWRLRWLSPKLVDLLRPRVTLPFLIVAVPWHVLCYLRNGRIFPYTLFVQHQFQRLTSGALMHTKPWWYYVPVLIGLLLPWAPLLLLLARRSLFRDPRLQFLLAWVLFGLVFFSVAPNKLPGYVLPLLPPVAGLMALALEETERAAYWLAACALLLVAILMAAPVLPIAVATGLSRTPRPPFQWIWLLPAALAAMVWILDSQSRRLAAVLSIAAGVTAGLVYVKLTATDELDRVASARPLWRQIGGHSDQVCADNLKRDFRYGLNYYSEVPLPECADRSMPLRAVQPPNMPPIIIPSLAKTVDLR